MREHQPLQAAREATEAGGKRSQQDGKDNTSFPWPLGLFAGGGGGEGVWALLKSGATAAPYGERLAAFMETENTG